MPPEPTTLREFQDVLVEILALDLPLDETLARLRTHHALYPYRGYIETFEPRMVEVASSLVKKWGDRERLGV